MKVIIAGGRDYELTAHDYVKLERLRRHISEVVCGCARGVDSAGEMWAQDHGIPVKRFPADWSLGKRAGSVRNREMAEYAEALIAFPGGRGTADMVEVAREKGLKVFDLRDPLDLLSGC